MRALTVVGPFGGRFADGPEGRVEASDDGRTWATIRTLVGPAHNAAPERSFAFPATSARFFRVLWTTPEVSREPYPHAPGIPLAELALVPGARVDLFEDKAGFGVLPDLDIPSSPALHDADAGAIDLHPEARRLAEQAAERLRLSARGFTRVLRVARTVADLGGAPHVRQADVAEALAFRHRVPGRAV